jgi:hypothetical protein
MEKDQKTPMFNRVIERLNEEKIELKDTQEKLRLKQKQIAEKLLGECATQGIKAQLKTPTHNDEPTYVIELSYDLGVSYVSKIVINPVYAKLGKSQESNSVYFVNYKHNTRTLMNDVASLFRAIEDDMYFYYKYK